MPWKHKQKRSEKIIIFYRIKTWAMFVILTSHFVQETNNFDVRSFSDIGRIHHRFGDILQQPNSFEEIFKNIVFNHYHVHDFIFKLQLTNTNSKVVQVDARTLCLPAANSASSTARNSPINPDKTSPCDVYHDVCHHHLKLISAKIEWNLTWTYFPAVSTEIL